MRISWGIPLRLIKNDLPADNGAHHGKFPCHARHICQRVICGTRVEDIDDTLIQQVRYLDKLVDELAKGKKLEKILRGS